MDNSILIFPALQLESQFKHLNNWYNLSPLLILFFGRDLSGNQLQQLPQRVFDRNTKLWRL